MPDAQLLEVAGQMATKIASYSQPVVVACKEVWPHSLKVQQQHFRAHSKKDMGGGRGAESHQRNAGSQSGIRELFG